MPPISSASGSPHVEGIDVFTRPGICFKASIFFVCELNRKPISWHSMSMNDECSLLGHFMSYSLCIGVVITL